MYRFDKKAERFEWMGAAHAYEVPYAFNNVTANDYLGDIDPKLALDMSTAWANFARTGDPSIDKASWQTYDLQTRDTMIFGEDGSMTMEQDPWKEQRELTAFAYKYMPL
jgi:para-nitrobenzyl esterase